MQAVEKYWFMGCFTASASPSQKWSPPKKTQTLRWFLVLYAFILQNGRENQLVEDKAHGAIVRIQGLWG